MSKPSSGSSNSLVRKIFSSFVVARTCFSQSGRASAFSAASNRGSASAAVMRSPVKPRKVRAISRNQAYWAVLSYRSMCRMIARTRSRGVTSLPSGAWVIPAEWASSV